MSKESSPIEADKEDVGKLVHYFDEGWRVGTLEKVKKNVAHIKPYNRLSTAKGRSVQLEVAERLASGDVFINVRKL